MLDEFYGSEALPELPASFAEAACMLSELDNGYWNRMGVYQRRLEALNGPDADSYHCWSSNSRWIIWVSRRLDGLYSRLFIAHIDADGNASKPFLLPQKDTRHDARLLCSYNVPELITGPVTFDPEQMARIAKTDPGIDVSFRE